jgi:serine protease Do
MFGCKQTALAGALVMTAALAPATARAQSRLPRAYALEVGRGSRIGVTVHNVEDTKDSKDTKDTKAAYGVVVDTVDPGGPADKAGVKAGDAITQFDGERVRSVRQFSRLVQETPDGRAVPVALSRGGQTMNVTVTAEAASFDDGFSMRLLDVARAPRPPLPPEPPAAPRIAPALPPLFGQFFTPRRLGVTIETLDSQLAQYFGVKDGVLVKSVSADSEAERLGLKAGDVITSINGRQIYETSDVNRAIERMDDSDDITIDVTRDRKTQTLKGKLEARSRGRTWMF